MYSYKECERALENRKARVNELIKYFMTRIKQVCVCALILFCVIAVCLAVKYKNNIKDENPVTLEQLNDEQQKRVKSILRLYSELGNMDDYKANSAFMSINPFQCNISTTQFLIIADDEKTEKAAYEAYKNYISFGGIKEVVNNELGERINTPSDLVEIADKLIIDDNEIVIGENVICIKAVSSDPDLANEVMQIAKICINDYSVTVTKNIGEHDIKLLAENSYLGKDESVLEEQELIEKEQNDKREQITNLENTITSQEKTVLENEKQNIENVSVGENTEKKLIFYIAVSLVFSIVFTFVFFVIYYLVNTKLKSSREMADLFGILGIDLEKGNKKNQKLVSKEVELICKNNDIKNILFVLMEDKEKKVYDDVFEMIEHVEIEGGSINIVKNILTDVSAMEMIQEYANIILVPSLYKTSYNEILEMIQKCEKFKINIMASVVSGE